MAGSVIVAGARTPIGKFQGGLSSVSATDLGGAAIAGALARAGISGEDVDYAIMGQVILAGSGQVPARQAAVAGGLPMSVPSRSRRCRSYSRQSSVSESLEKIASSLVPGSRCCNHTSRSGLTTWRSSNESFAMASIFSKSHLANPGAELRYQRSQLWTTWPSALLTRSISMVIISTASS